MSNSKENNNFEGLEGKAIKLESMYMNHAVGGVIIKDNDNKYYWINRYKDEETCSFVDEYSTGDQVIIKNGCLCIGNATTKEDIQVKSVEPIDVFFTADIDDNIKKREYGNPQDLPDRYGYKGSQMALWHVLLDVSTIYKDSDNEITNRAGKCGLFSMDLLTTEGSQQPKSGDTMAYIRIGAKVFIFGKKFEPIVFAVNNEHLKKDPEALEMYKEREDRIKQVIEYKSKNNPELGKGKYVEYELPQSTKLKFELSSTEYQRYIKARKNKIRAKLSPESLQTVDSRKNERKKREMKSKEIYKNRSYS